MRRVIALVLTGLLLPNILLADRFSKKDEVVYDSKTKFSWQSKPSTQKVTWKRAVKYCAELSYSGYTDWRLANIYELKSLVDYKKYNPAIATSLIDIKTDDFYWSSSKDSVNTSSKWDINFINGRNNWHYQSRKEYVLCVRG